MECRDCFSRWRSWIRPFIIAGYFIVIVIALPLLIIEFHLNSLETHVQAWFIGGIFVLMAIPISLWGIIQHLVHYTQPVLQRNIIRILWMVPIYAVDAWFALRFKEAAIYLDTLRECYEAYVIYSFMSYLLNYLHCEFSDLDVHVSYKAQTKHFFPFCLFPSWKMGREFIQVCKHGVLQYTVIRPITTVVALLTELGGVYGEGDFDFKKSWVYLVAIDNFSQIWAMYCLVLFYQAMKEELQPINPVPKFLCVKAVVFLSFWQQVTIAILVATGVIRADNTFGYYTTDDVATGLQDFIICLEMFLAALAHYFSFSHKPYIDPMAEQTDCCQSFVNMWDISDVRRDVADHVRHVGNTVSAPLRGRNARASSERTPLLYGGSSGARSPMGNGSRAPTVLIDVVDNIPEVDSAREADRDSLGTIGSLTASCEGGEASQESHRKSFNASLLNYAEFSDSDSVSTRSKSETHTAVTSDEEENALMGEPAAGRTPAHNELLEDVATATVEVQLDDDGLEADVHSNRPEMC